MRWLIAVPCWGDFHRHLFLRAPLPSQIVALGMLGKPFRYVIHCDWSDDDKAAVERQLRFVAGFDGVTWLSAPVAANVHQALGDAHRQAAALADYGERVVLTNADIVVSREAYVVAERQFVRGRKLVMIAGTRSRAEDLSEPVPAGLPSRQLLDWATEHMHPITRDCHWGGAWTITPSIILFRHRGNLCARSFHMNPLALVKDRDLVWQGTNDTGLPTLYRPDEIHVVRGRDEASMAELSPADRTIPQHLLEPLSVDRVVDWARLNTAPIHRWFFTHRTVLLGDENDCGDNMVAGEVLARLAA